jgi:hypothetical protein
MELILYRYSDSTLYLPPFEMFPLFDLLFAQLYIKYTHTFIFSYSDKCIIAFFLAQNCIWHLSTDSLIICVKCESSSICNQIVKATLLNRRKFLKSSIPWKLFVCVVRSEYMVNVSHSEDSKYWFFNNA